MLSRRMGMAALAISIAAIAFIALSTAAGTAAEGPDEGPADEGSQTESSNADLDDYSKAYGVTPEEARRQWTITDEARELQASLRSDARDVFAGMWLDYEPEFAVVVGVLPGGEESVRATVKELGLVDWVRLAPRDHSLVDLHAMQDSLSELLPASLDYSSGIDQSEGLVNVYVHEYLSDSQLASFELPNGVAISFEGPPVPAVDVYGGLSLSNGCTAGFSVEETNGFQSGVTTAGHCENSTSYNGQNLPWENGNWIGRLDVQWHTTPNLGDPNKIRVTQQGATRVVDDRMPAHQFIEDEHVCKYGRATLYDCGTLDDLSFDPSDICVPSSTDDFVRVTPNPQAGDMAEGGDSGGPVFHDNPATAYGVMNCEFTSNQDMLFMPQNFMPDIGVQVDI